VDVKDVVDVSELPSQPSESKFVYTRDPVSKTKAGGLNADGSSGNVVQQAL
jgi:hypothetical protein